MNLQKQFEKAQDLRNNGKINEAIKLYLKLRKENLSVNKKFASECLHMIGVAYFQAGKFEEAEKELRKSFDEFKKIGDHESIGFVLRDFGMVASSKGDFGKAKKYLTESIKVLQKIKNKGHEGMSRVKLGRVLAEEGNFNKAYREINKGIELLNGSKENFFLSSAYLDRAKVDVQKSLAILNSFANKDEFKHRREEIDKILL